MGSMIHGWYPFLNVWPQIFVLWQSRSESGEKVAQVRMQGLLGVIRLHGPKRYGGISAAILLC